MKHSKELFAEIVKGITLDETREEKEGMARILMEKFFGVGYAEIMANVPVHLTKDYKDKFESAISRLNKGEPIQYIVEEAYFFGYKFHVQQGVLVPRPETEELVSQVLEFVHGKTETDVKILDVGTGSGCISVTLALKLPKAEIFATDISLAALDIAARNASEHEVTVKLFKHDILNEELPFHDLDVIASNPPYIARTEQQIMKANVVDFEPHLALFVDDDDPCIFYKHICSAAGKAMKSGGLIIFEINERFGNEVAAVVAKNGFQDVRIVKDLSGKDRIVRGIQP